MRVAWIKYANDTESFKIPEALGFDVVKLDDVEKTDEKIGELVERDYKMVVLSNEIAGFSEDIIKKYNTDKNINIIIASSKEYT